MLNLRSHFAFNSFLTKLLTSKIDKIPAECRSFFSKNDIFLLKIKNNYVKNDQNSVLRISHSPWLPKLLRWIFFNFFEFSFITHPVFFFFNSVFCIFITKKNLFWWLWGVTSQVIGEHWTQGFIESQEQHFLEKMFVKNICRIYCNLKINFQRKLHFSIKNEKNVRNMIKIEFKNCPYPNVPKSFFWIFFFFFSFEFSGICYFSPIFYFFHIFKRIFVFVILMCYSTANLGTMDTSSSEVSRVSLLLFFFFKKILPTPRNIEVTAI